MYGTCVSQMGNMRMRTINSINRFTFHRRGDVVEYPQPPPQKKINMILSDPGDPHDFCSPKWNDRMRYLAQKTGWDLKDQQQVVHKLRRVGCVHPRALQVNIKTGNLNKQLKRHKFLPFGDKSMEILEGWAAIYAASHSMG